MTGTLLAQWQGRASAAWSAAWGVPLVETYASIGSTNDRALELAVDPRNAFAVVIADEQTSGRGRRGARWHSPAGSGLWMSIVLPWSRPAPHGTLLVGLSVAEAIESAAGAVRVLIKWPNDLIMMGGKLGGILCESTGAGVVAGIGINLRSLGEGAPTRPSYPSTSLEAEGCNQLSPGELAGSIISALGDRRGLGAELSAADLEGLGARDVLLGAQVDTDEHGRGIARGIAADGSLVLERSDGSRVRVMAGSVRPL